MEELITLTNSENFSSLGFTYLKKLTFETENSQLQLQISLIDEAEKEVEWVINAENVSGFKNFDSGNLMPYLKINLYENHPSLKIIESPEIQCKIIGVPDNKFQFLGKFYQLLQKEIGSWKYLEDFFWNMEYLFEEKEIPERFKGLMDVESNAEYINLPKVLVNPFEVLCKSENLQVQIGDEYESNYDNMKVLIFGNEIISPDNYSLNQSYIIAEKFTAFKKNNS
ncbi:MULTISPECIES: hypothetical protein [Chryseobacterium]|uniref:hypothetical protein n=1 Tax=Chryseobacterium TaxID=59732 RepID=UPI001957FE83|nr:MULTISPECIES: hypothetical protein [Chryseobacterium]MBM7420216.1 hypothetical protein [Chryseobacterium sp. JUb44]MDH6210155.1 hypothetical protein [Chryseobacterium sp. BIGb0186]WSO08880.1 hypothetical protein VUJ64_13710 [Chryseobacterium scophthalmum]